VIKHSYRVNQAPHLKANYLKVWMAHHAHPYMHELFTKREQITFLARSAMLHFDISGEPGYPFTAAAELLLADLSSGDDI
jgi:hypothetical protein